MKIKTILTLLAILTLVSIITISISNRKESIEQTTIKCFNDAIVNKTDPKACY